MSATLGHILSIVLAGGIIFVGLRFLVAPQAAVSGYGVSFVPEDGSSSAYLAAKGVRDIASGLFIFVLLAAATDDVLAWFLVAAAFIPLGDALIVLRHNGSKAVVYGVHGGTALVILIVAGLLLM